MPIWIPLALLFPALTSIVNILDKIIIDRFTPRLFYYVFWVGIVELALGLIGLGIWNGIRELSLATLLGSFITGMVSGVGLLLYLAALRVGQVTRVVPIWFLYPLMVAPLAAGFLSETISGLAILAILMAVLGAVLVSWHGNGERLPFGNPAVTVLALIAAAFLAVAFVLSKYHLDRVEFWHFFSLYRIGFAIPLLGVTLLTGVWMGALGMVRSRGFMGLVMLTEAIVTLVLVLRFAAVDRGPVSLVTAISAVQPAIVFVYVLALAKLYPRMFGEWVTRRTMVPQSIGIVVLTSGIVIICFEG